LADLGFCCRFFCFTCSPLLVIFFFCYWTSDYYPSFFSTLGAASFWSRSFLPCLRSCLRASCHFHVEMGENLPVLGHVLDTVVLILSSSHLHFVASHFLLVHSERFSVLPCRFQCDPLLLWGVFSFCKGAPFLPFELLYLSLPSCAAPTMSLFQLPCSTLSLRLKVSSFLRFTLSLSSTSSRPAPL